MEVSSSGEQSGLYKFLRELVTKDVKDVVVQVGRKVYYITDAEVPAQKLGAFIKTQVDIFVANEREAAKAEETPTEPTPATTE